MPEPRWPSSSAPPRASGCGSCRRKELFGLIVPDCGAGRFARNQHAIALKRMAREQSPKLFLNDKAAEMPGASSVKGLGLASRSELGVSCNSGKVSEARVAIVGKGDDGEMASAKSPTAS